MSNYPDAPLNPETGRAQSAYQAAWPVREDTGSEKAIAYSITVNAPAQELWEFLANPHRHWEIDGSESVKSKVDGPEQVQVGDTFKVAMYKYAIPYTMKLTTVAAEAPRIVEWQHPGKHTWRWEFEPVPGEPQKTKVTETFDYSQSPAIAARGFKLAGILKGNANAIRGSLTRLAGRYLEQNREV